MAIALIDGWDHYASAVTGEGGVSSVWSFTSTSGVSFVPGILDGVGRALNYALNSSNYARRNISGSSDTITLCFRFKGPSTFPGSNVLCLLANGSGDQGWIEVTSSGALRYKVGTFANTALGTILGTSSFLMTTSRVYFVELKVKIHASTGTVDLWIDGTNVLSLTGQNTKAQSAATITVIGLGACNTNGETWAFDDLYVLGASGDSRLGDRRVLAILPSADTAQADWTKSSGGVGFSLIDEDQADTATYIEALAASEYSLFDFANLTYTPATIDAIAIEFCAKKTDAGAVSVRTKQKSGATTTNGADQSVGSSFVHTQEIFVVNPATSSAWTAATVNSLQVGVERTV